MLAHQALNIAKLLGGEADIAGERHVFNPESRCRSAPVDMDVRRLAGLVL
jgi:hypothetical protein